MHQRLQKTLLPTKQTLQSCFLAALTVIMLTACDLTERRYYESGEIDHAEERSDTVLVMEYVNDELEREIFAAFVERYYDAEKTVSHDVTLRDYEPGGKLVMTLTADILTVDEILNTYTAKGDVVITRDEGVLKTEHLVWYEDEDKIFSPVEATIIRGENVMRGFELTTDTEFSKIEMKRVTAEGVIDDEDLDW